MTLTERILTDTVVPPGEPWSAEEKQGQRLRIVDLEGTQAVDFLCYNARDPVERYCAADTMKIDRVLQTELDANVQQALIRVQGTQTFYHLVQLEPPPSSQQQQNQDQQDQQDQQENQDQSENQDQEGDSPEKDEPSEEQEDSKGKDGQEEQEDGQEPQDEKDGQSEEEENEEKDGEGRPTDPRDAEVQRIEDILQALEESDDNFQMRKALENTPSRNIEKDW